MRKLSFIKSSKFYYEIKDGDIEEGFHIFKYFKKRDYDSVIFLIKAMKKLFANYKGNAKDEVENLIRNIIMYRFSTHRKFITNYDFFYTYLYYFLKEIKKKFFYNYFFCFINLYIKWFN